MTLEEIRREKKVAEDAIRDILRTLQDRTGLFPEMVDVHALNVRNLEEARPHNRIAAVQITMEAV